MNTFAIILFAFSLAFLVVGSICWRACIIAFRKVKNDDLPAGLEYKMAVAKLDALDAKLKERSSEREWAAGVADAIARSFQEKSDEDPETAILAIHIAGNIARLIRTLPRSADPRLHVTSETIQ